MITKTIIVDNCENLDIEIKKYFHEFYPAGYGTRIKEIRPLLEYDNGKLIKIKYMITFERFESCD